MSRRCKGLTLLELVVTIVVIAVLATVSAGVYSTITESANAQAARARATDAARLLQARSAVLGTYPNYHEIGQDGAVAVGTARCQVQPSQPQTQDPGRSAQIAGSYQVLCDGEEPDQPAPLLAQAEDWTGLGQEVTLVEDYIRLEDGAAVISANAWAGSRINLATRVQAAGTYGIWLAAAFNEAGQATAGYTFEVAPDGTVTWYSNSPT